MRTRTIKNDWYGDITLTLWPHGDLEATCGDCVLHGSDNWWQVTCKDSGYPECDGSDYAFDNFESMPSLLYFFDNC
jgi:hypothetical protein